VKPPFQQKKSWVWWYLPVIPAMARNLKLEDQNPSQAGQKSGPYLKKKNNSKKELEV
jgi:hypothetical protein